MVNTAMAHAIGIVASPIAVGVRMWIPQQTLLAFAKTVMSMIKKPTLFAGPPPVVFIGLVTKALPVAVRLVAKPLLAPVMHPLRYVKT
jgi:hypothetical protein